MINERILPNPFKSPGAELSNVLDNIERELCRDEPVELPEFLGEAFLQKLEAEIAKGAGARKQQGHRIVAKLRRQLLGK
jgi:hypothetical protein